MPTIPIRIGAPRIFWREYDDPSIDWKEIFPTTGDISFEEIWSQRDLTKVVVKFSVLGSPKNLPPIKKKLQLSIFYPPNADGLQEERRAISCEVIKIKHKVKDNEPETKKYKIQFFNFNWQEDPTYWETITYFNREEDIPKTESKEVEIAPNGSIPYKVRT